METDHAKGVEVMPKIDICQGSTTDKNHTCIEGSIPEILAMMVICINRLSSLSGMPKELILLGLSACVIEDEDKEVVIKTKGIN